MKRYKQFVIGFLVGALLFSIAPVSAAIEEFICYRADYKVVVNGAEYSNADLPILNYKGNTYAPFRSILEKAGLNVTWNAELNQAEVTSNPTSTQNSNVDVNALDKENMQYDPITGIPVGAEYIDNVRNNRKYRTLSYNGKIYISEDDLRKIFGIEYTIRNTFANPKTNEYIVINPQTDSFSTKEGVYTDLSLFSKLIGE